MTTRSRWLIVAPLLAALLISAAVAGGAKVGTDRADTIRTEQPRPDIQTAPETDTTTTRIAVRPNGSAVWQLTIRMELETEADETEFSAFEGEFERNRTQYVDEYRSRMTGVVDNAARLTGRDMNATGFEAETGIQETPPRYGFVTYQFTWEGFAETDDGTIAVGDVFDGGYFLGEDDILILDVPAEYNVGATNPTPDRATDGTLQWNGPRSFSNERPQAEFTTGDSSGDTDEAVPASEQTAGGDSSAMFAIGGLLLILVVAGLAYGRYYQSNGRDSGSGDESSSNSAGTVRRDSAASASAEGLATDEDRVRSLLEAEDGRMRQADISDRLDWSDSKTSRVLSEMADNGDVEKLRIGRENVIDLLEDDRATDQ